MKKTRGAPFLSGGPGRGATAARPAAVPRRRGCDDGAGAARRGGGLSWRDSDGTRVEEKGGDEGSRVRV
jgi:hypothetical protein